MTIQTRAAKGAPLTWAEVDQNFTELNTGKASASALATEVSRATAAEAAEQARALAAESALNSAVAAESTRAQAAEAAKESLSNKGSANGYAGLDATGKVPAAQLPDMTPASSFNWSATKTANFTAVAMNGYPVNTTSAAITATLPASAARGDTITFIDYAKTFATNKLTVNPNGLKINSSSSSFVLNTNGASVTFVYIDSSQGWLCVSGFSNNPSLPPATISYFMVAGGGSGGASTGWAYYHGSGGGAGGVRQGSFTFASGTSLTVLVGAGGAAVVGGIANGNKGNDSVITGAPVGTLTAIGGGYGAAGQNVAGGTGGSGGGGAWGGTGGSGTPGQGNNGGTPTQTNYSNGAGGGGAGSAPSGANGGAGTLSTIPGLSAYFAGGGGSGSGVGGVGGGGNGSAAEGGTAQSGAVNTGGGGGGLNFVGNSAATGSSGSGGAGEVIFAYESKTVLATGGEITYSGGVVMHTFKTSGTFVIN